MKKSERKRLSARYPYIVQYDAMMGSFQYWTDTQLLLADRVKAPGNTYQMNGGTCNTLSDITNPDLRDYFNLGWLSDKTSFEMF